MAHKGKFKPQNPHKYIGDPTNIIYRSSWEVILMDYLDKHQNIKRWSSEEIIIPYFSPIDGKKHRYFPDFFVEQEKEGKIEKILIEIKPKKQTVPPIKNLSPTGKITKSYLTEVKNWGINQAKWNSAVSYCNNRGWKFAVMTEDHLIGKK